MKKSIGGYFELADHDIENGYYPVNGFRLNTSRNALEYILKSIPICKHIYLPLYTCEAVIEPLKRLTNIEFSFYNINDKLEIANDIVLHDGDYIIANNYFGLKDAYIAQLAQKYDDRLIVDNAQALFASVASNVKAYYSPRKFIGVADGGFAVGIDCVDIQNYELDDSSKHNSHLFIRKHQGAEEGFKDYQQNEIYLDNQPIRRMSNQTEDILLHIDYRNVIAKRKQNYEFLHKALHNLNQLTLPAINDIVACPMVYPFLTDDLDLRSRLIKNKIFVARYWSNVLKWSNPVDWEYYLAKHLIPLPIDQRYDIDDMQTIVNHILNK